MLNNSITATSIRERLYAKPDKVHKELSEHQRP
jgi:hypothetical protein